MTVPVSTRHTISPQVQRGAGVHHDPGLGAAGDGPGVLAQRGHLLALPRPHPAQARHRARGGDSVTVFMI